MPVAEQALIERCQAGDTAAFEELVSRYEKKVYNLTYRFTGNPEDAKDLAQEAFIKVYLAIGDFQGQSAFSTWLYRLVTNTCLDEVRRRRRQPIGYLDEAVATDDGSMERQLVDPAEGPAEAAERNELRSAIQAGIDALEPEYRMAVILRDIQGHSYEEIAQILNCNLGTVKSRINRGRRAVKDKLISRELFGVPCVKVVQK